MYLGVELANERSVGYEEWDRSYLNFASLMWKTKKKEKSPEFSLSLGNNSNCWGSFRRTPRRPIYLAWQPQARSRISWAFNRYLTSWNDCCIQFIRKRLLSFWRYWRNVSFELARRKEEIGDFPPFGYLLSPSSCCSKVALSLASSTERCTMVFI